MAAIGTGTGIPAPSRIVWDAVKISAQQSEGVEQGLEEVKDAALSWEQQAQGALQQLDSLKDILEESAAWSGACCRALGSALWSAQSPDYPATGCRIVWWRISWQRAAASGRPGQWGVMPACQRLDIIVLVWSEELRLPGSCRWAG